MDEPTPSSSSSSRPPLPSNPSTSSLTHNNRNPSHSQTHSRFNDTSSTTPSTTTTTARPPSPTPSTPSKKSRSPNPPHPHLPHSADSLLHHLHTDPQASHITVAAVNAPVIRHMHDVSGAVAGVGADLVQEEEEGEGDGEGRNGNSNGDAVRRAPLGLMGRPVDVLSPLGSSGSGRGHARSVGSASQPTQTNQSERNGEGKPMPSVKGKERSRDLGDDIPSIPDNDFQIPSSNSTSRLASAADEISPRRSKSTQSATNPPGGGGGTSSSGSATGSRKKKGPTRPSTAPGLTAEMKEGELPSSSQGLGLGLGQARSGGSDGQRSPEQKVVGAGSAVRTPKIRIGGKTFKTGTGTGTGTNNSSTANNSGTTTPATAGVSKADLASQMGYFDIQRGKDRRGKNKVRAPVMSAAAGIGGGVSTTTGQGNHSRQSTGGSSGLSGPGGAGLEGLTAGLGDGMYTPSSVEDGGGRSVGNGRDGDDELSEESEEGEVWPAQEDEMEVGGEEGEFEEDEDEDRDEDDEIVVVDGTESGDTPPTARSTADNTLQFAQQDTPTSTSVPTSTSMLPLSSEDAALADSCVGQFINQFEGPLKQKIAHDAAAAGGGGRGRMGIIGQVGSFDASDAQGSGTVSLTRREQGNVSGSLAGASVPQGEGIQIPQRVGAGHQDEWNLFMQAYGSGRWDPNRIPNPPKSSLDRSPVNAFSARSSPGTSFSVPPDVSRGPIGGSVTQFGLDKSEGAFGLANLLTRPKQRLSKPPELTSGSSGGSSSRTGSTSAPPSSASGEAPHITRHHSQTDLPRRWTYEDKKDVQSPQSMQPRPGGMKRAGPGQISLASGAAHVRLASANYSSADFEPLGAPSPERELLDPMANAMTQIDKPKSRKNSSSSDSSVYRNRSKLNALSGSWDDYSESVGRLESLGTTLSTIAASPATTPNEPHGDYGEQAQSRPPLSSATPDGTRNVTRRPSGGISKRIPPASAPIEWNGSTNGLPGDYFGDAGARLAGSPAPASSRPMHPASRTSSSQTITGYTPGFAPGFGQRSASAVFDSGDESAIDSSGRETLPPGSKPRLHPHASADTLITNEERRNSKLHNLRSTFKATTTPPSQQGESDASSYHSSSDEHLYFKNGYLRAPIPPNEAQRRKALYRYKIMHTAQDANFDRIAHLAKLVFSTRIVLISLVDEGRNWHKVDFGLNSSTAERGDSFCSHVILSKNDEPLVVLDTHLDWRFQKHPFVIGPPYIRFYAGAPLRTAEGFNIGSLCLIDTQPRSEFPPRSRMALKEFAAITIREMELWRDKTRLKARDRIQTSMERFTRECLELDNVADVNPANASANMEKVYERAARLVRRTLELDGAFVLDLSQFESVEVTGPDGDTSMAYQADPYEMSSMASEEEYHVPDAAFGEKSYSFGPLPPWTILGTAENDPAKLPDRSRPSSSSEHAKFSDFLKDNPQGKIFEKVVPTWIRHILPSGLQWAMIVPIFNIDKHPFALLCAYTCDKTKQYLEGYELQFLRAIGVVILSAVLKRRMVLADKAKSNFISNISHELRTPLHGILAAAELLSDTTLDSNQQAFLSTVQACGNSLIETVNHVLDFTKLSGNHKTSQESSIRPASVNLAQLVEETVEGCWIGQRARAQQGQSEIGSFYSPPSPLGLGPADKNDPRAEHPYVETVVDIGFRDRGWHVRCEKGGIRRVLMNLISNSLKFTRDGYIQVTLRELPHTPGSKTMPIEMAVIDTGKGISKTFLKEQLFHPFSQENPLQTGTGLGLAIVNSIVRSESVNGKVDVWSSEGLGTEIKITLNVEIDGPSLDKADDAASQSSRLTGSSGFGRDCTISTANFRHDHRGSRLNRELVIAYTNWWAFTVLPDDSEELGDIIIADEEGPLLRQLLEQNDVSRAVLILSTSRVVRPNSAMQAYQKAGGFAQMVFKPVGPERLQSALKAAVQSSSQSTPSQGTRSVRSDYFSPGLSTGEMRSPGSDISWQSSRKSWARTSSHQGDDASRPSVTRESSTATTIGSPVAELPNGYFAAGRQISNMRQENLPGALLRRRSEEDRPLRRTLPRPSIGPRSTTYQHNDNSIHAMLQPARESDVDEVPSTPGSPGSSISTISLADGGVMLKVAATPDEVRKEKAKPRILLVDDNHINLELLGAYLRKKNIEHQRAMNGQLSVDIFANSPAGHWDIVLMDLSMPILDGFGATKAIRKIESDRRTAAGEKSGGQQVVQQRTKIFALSGRAAAEDKKHAFSAGVDGYLVKPVRLASLDTIIKKLGF